MSDVGIDCQCCRIYTRHVVAGKSCCEERVGIEYWCVSSDSSPQLLLTDLGLFTPQGLQEISTKEIYQCVTPPTHKRNMRPLHPHSPMRILTEPSWAGLTITTISIHVSTSVLHEHEHEHKYENMNTSTDVSLTITTIRCTWKKDGMPTPTKWLTSQCCTAMSIDTCTAIARFLSWFRGQQY